MDKRLEVGMWMVLNTTVPTLVSDCDFDLLSGLKFAICGGYLRCRSSGSSYYDIYLHLIVAKRMGLSLSNLIDHRDRNRFHNQRTNLREATKSQNNINSKVPITSSTEIKGVGWHVKAQKWRAHIQVNKIHIHLGLFDDINDAMTARERAEIRYYGQFAQGAL